MCGFRMPAHKHHSLASSGHTELIRIKVSKCVPKRVEHLEAAIAPEGWKHLTAPLCCFPMASEGGESFSLYSSEEEKQISLPLNRKEPLLVLLNSSELCIRLSGHMVRLPLFRSKG